MARPRPTEGPELRGAMAAAPWPAPCCVRRGARPHCRLGPSFWPAALGRPSWPSCGTGVRAGARGASLGAHGHAGLGRAGIRPAPLGPRRGGSPAGLAPRASVAGTPGTGRCGGQGALGAGGGPQAESRGKAWRAMCQRLRSLTSRPVTKPAHAAVRLWSLDSGLHPADLDFL